MNARIKYLVFILAAVLCLILFSILKNTLHWKVYSMSFITLTILFHTLFSTKSDDENYYDIIIEEEHEIDIDHDGKEIIDIIEEIDETDKIKLAQYDNIITSKTEKRSREFNFQAKIAGIAILAGLLISMGIEAIFTILGMYAFTTRFDHYLRINLIIVIIIEICLFFIGLWLRKIAISKQKKHIPFS